MRTRGTRNAEASSHGSRPGSRCMQRRAPRNRQRRLHRPKAVSTARPIRHTASLRRERRERADHQRDRNTAPVRPKPHVPSVDAHGAEPWHPMSEALTAEDAASPRGGPRFAAESSVAPGTGVPAATTRDTARSIAVSDVARAICRELDRGPRHPKATHTSARPELGVSTTPPLGFGTFRRNQRGRSERAGLPHQHLPLSEFLTLPAVYTHPHLVALFRATSARRLATSRASPAPPAVAPLGARFSLVVPRGSRRPEPLLATDSDFRAFIRRGVRHPSMRC